MIDPQQVAFPASSHGWSLSRHSKLLSTIPHQVEPYIGTFDCDPACFRIGFYRGTMFRFPLRSRPSSLSSSVYDEQKVRELLENFEADARLLLLFLRNLERISVYERERGSKTCRLVYRVELADGCVADVRRARADFVEKLRDGAWQDRTVLASYPVTIATESSSSRDRSATSQRRRFAFLVTNYCCGGHVSPLFRNLFRDPELGYLPWVGAAMSLDEAPTAADVDGRLFCFLPLPHEATSLMGLPVHIHGFFALEQNRKYVKWPGTYSFADTYMDKGLLWNQCLLREAVPRAYVGLLCEAIRLHAAHSPVAVTVPVIYRAFCNHKCLERRWEPVITTVYVEMLKQPMVFHSSPDASEWIEAKNAIFNNLDPFDEATPVIMDILLASNVNVVTVPEHVLAAVKRYATFSLNVISPTLVASAYQSAQTSLGLHWESKMKLLRYLLRQSKYELLDGLELLPLANGGFDVFHFNPKKADRAIYVVPSTEFQTLLPGLKDDFLEMEIDEDIKNMLMKAANRGEATVISIRPHRMHSIDEIYCDRCLCVCLSGRTVQKRLAQSRHRFWARLVWAQGTMVVKVGRIHLQSQGVTSRRYGLMSNYFEYLLLLLLILSAAVQPIFMKFGPITHYMYEPQLCDFIRFWYIFCMVFFTRMVRIAGSRFWCAACNSVNRTCSTSSSLLLLLLLLTLVRFNGHFKMNMV